MGITENESEDFCFFWTKIGIPQNLCNAFWLHVLAASIWTGCLPLFSVSRSFQDSPTCLPCPQCVGHTRAATSCEVNRCSFSGLTCISYLWNGRFGPDELISEMFCDRISSLLGNSFNAESRHISSWYPYYEDLRPGQKETQILETDLKEDWVAKAKLQT